jgi:Uma2 family endonuclease
MIERDRSIIQSAPRIASLEERMVQTPPKTVTFDQFIAWYPEDAGSRYELHSGVIVEMPKPTGQHSDVGGLIVAELNFEIRRTKLPYRIPKECVLRPAHSETGYEPDIVVLDNQGVKNEPRWAKESIITKGSSVPLAIEITSTNWQDDDALKLEDYEAMGIAEYWIADYLGLGGKRFIGDPKQPTFSVYQLINGKYQVRQFRGRDRIISPTFPTLKLTAQQIFEAADFS